MMYAVNISENDLSSGIDNDYVKKVKEYASKSNSEVVSFSAKVESELVEIEDEELRQEFIETLGITTPSLDRLITVGYRMLGLITYFTAGEKEVRAWTIKKGTNAQNSAGEIHTDIQKGFIRAEVVEFNKFIEEQKNGLSDKSKAEAIAAQTTKIISERYKQDTVFYEQFSKRISKLIEELKTTKKEDVASLYKEMKNIGIQDF